jgi:hypothetical protein
MARAKKRRAAPGKERTRLHGDQRWRFIVLQIDAIKETDLSQSDRDILKDDAKRWKRMSGGAHLDDWLSFGPGMLIRRQLAMKLAHVNAPKGGVYAATYSQLMAIDGFDVTDKTVTNSLTAVTWLHDDPLRLQVLKEIRERMTPGQRARLNSPISARENVTKELNARKNSDSNVKPRDRRDTQKDQITELKREIAELQHKLTKATDGSLFDLKKDNADDIATVIVNSVGAHKAKAIASGIAAWFKPKPKPAG